MYTTYIALSKIFNLVYTKIIDFLFISSFSKNQFSVILEECISILKGTQLQDVKQNLEQFLSKIITSQGTFQTLTPIKTLFILELSIKSE